MPSLHPGQPIDAEVRRVGSDIVTETRELLSRPHDRGSEGWHDAVHEVRKSMKELRALTRLVRIAAPEIHDVGNVLARDLARRLSDVRDAQAMLETLDLLADAFPGVADDQLAEVRDERVGERDRLARAAPSSDDLLDDLDELAADVRGWQVPDDGFEALAGGLAKTYRRVQDRLERAAEDPSTEALHELRKRVKYHRLHAELLAPAWPTVLDAREEAWHDLTDALGDDHDLAVLRGVLADDDVGRAVAALVDRRRAELQQDALLGVRRATSEDAEAMVDRFRAAWTAAARMEAEPTTADRALTLEPET